MSLLLHGGVEASGRRLDVLVDAVSATITAAGPQLDPALAVETVDCSGMVVLSAAAEPHAHLDKVLTAELPNPSGDLMGAISTWRAHAPTLTAEDVQARARTIVHDLVAHGVTAVRSHVDLGPHVGLLPTQAIAALREELSALIDLELVALCAPPHAEFEALHRAALEAGADVVGGAPHTDSDPIGETAAKLALAHEYGLPLDLHTDETLDPSKFALAQMPRMLRETGFTGRVAASHSVSLGMQPPDVQQAVAADLAAAGIAVIALPQTNLYLQGRGITQAPPRGLTAIRPLLDAGVTVAAGADNVRDPFCAMGRADPLETAALLVMAAHLTPQEAWHAVSTAARAVLGLAPVTMTPGDPAELLVVRGSDLTDALARASEHRLVVHRGRLIARTTVETTLNTPVLT